MSNSILKIQRALTKNRAEELGVDVWTHFVVPLFFDQIDLQDATKPRVLIGGRGCGKTMLLRYLAHQTRFSRNRGAVPSEELEQIGLYWRADTQFVTTMMGRGFEEDSWQAAFGHLLALSISRELLASIQSIRRSSCGIPERTFVDLRFDALRAFDPVLGDSIESLDTSLEKLEWEFQIWLNNPRTTPQPKFLPVREFPRAIILRIRSQIHQLASTRFSVYIDEYENLLKYQQVIVNTMLKHSEPPLIFHLAMKRNGMQTLETLGGESITDIADYRKIDLDQYLHEQDFVTYAAEILLLRLSSVYDVPSLVSPALLNDPNRLAERRSADYKKGVVAAAKAIFPTLAREELAEAVFSEPALLDQLKRAIALALKAKASVLSASHYVRSDFKQASLIVPALLNRRNVSPESILAELKLLQQGKENRFTGPTNWIHNNFEGCLLYLYAPFDRTCPFYAGFETYISLAQANLRHFLELCYKAIKRLSRLADSSALVIPPREQAEAAKQASAAFISEIKGFGKMGNRLYRFVLTLGSLFALSQRRPAQSEPEISHFSISGGSGTLSVDDNEFFTEAVKWSVLIEHSETKLKDPLQPFGSEWVLNPIYAPYFHITYRKRRKISLKVEDVIVLVRGSYDERRSLLRRFSENWELDARELQMSLFPDLGGKE